MTLTAEQVLQDLNDGEPVNLGSLDLWAITKGYTETIGTGGAVGKIGTLTEDSFSPFSRGETLIVDKETGREPFGEGLKPASGA